MNNTIFHKVNKKVLIATLLLALLINLANLKINAVSPTANNVLQQSSTTRIFAGPPIVRKNPTEKFNVSITVEQVVRLNTVEVRLSWLPRLLNVTKWVEGPFLGTNINGSSTLRVMNIFQEAGYLAFGNSILESSYVNGTGIVLTVEFLVEATGETSLHLFSTKLIRPNFTLIPHQTSDGYFFNAPTRVYVNPETSSADLLQTFTVNITVAFVMNLYSWQLNLTWRADALNASNVTEEQFLKSDGAATQFYYQKSTLQNATGKYESVYANSTRLATLSGVNTNGTILSVTFLVEKTDAIRLDVNQDFLYDPSKTAISHLTYDGTFTPAAISVTPHRNTAPINNSFTISIQAANITDLYTWQLNLTWRAAILEATNVTEGPFLKSAGSTAFNYAIDNATGTIYLNSTLLGAVSGATGTGMLANVTFFVEATRERTSLDLLFMKLLDSNKAEILCRRIDGVFTNIPPTSEFTYSPNPAVNRSVSFNASLSYDLDPDGYIVKYTWDFGDGDNATATVPTVNHVYANIGNFNVNLTATDNDGLSNTKTRSITVKRESSLTISASPPTIELGESTTIEGTLNPIIDSASIEIYGRLEGATSWGSPLQILNTNASSQYSYVWRPAIAGIYEVVANFTGDTTTLPSGSPNITTTVNKLNGTITLSATPANITIGQNTTVTGLITPTVSNQAVTIWIRKLGIQTFDNLTTVRTNETSQFTYKWTPPSDGIYQLKANWTGDTNTLPAESSLVSITVNKIVSTLTISVSPTNITKGQTVTITGAITPLKVNVDVVLQYRKLGETSWNNIATVKTSQNGEYSQTWTPQGAGTYEVKAVWNGDENTLGDESDVEVVQVAQVPEAGTPNILLYAAIGVALVIAIALLLYFTKIRKAK